MIEQTEEKWTRTFKLSNDTGQFIIIKIDKLEKTWQILNHNGINSFIFNNKNKNSEAVINLLSEAIVFVLKELE